MIQESYEQACERFWARVEKGGECWLWLGCLDRYGYGQFTYQKKNWRAHRFAYMTKEPSLAAHDKLDHECETRACVNPAHLRPLSQRENVLRSKTNPVAVNARKTHCVKGHEFTPENTGYSPIEGHAGRYCKTCRSESLKRMPRVTNGKIDTAVESAKDRMQREFIEKMTR